MDLSTAKYIMDYIYFNRANETAFKYYKKVSVSNGIGGAEQPQHVAYTISE